MVNTREAIPKLRSEHQNLPDKNPQISNAFWKKIRTRAGSSGSVTDELEPTGSAPK